MKKDYRIYQLKHLDGIVNHNIKYSLESIGKKIPNDLEKELKSFLSKFNEYLEKS
jgi:hypothetical protein